MSTQASERGITPPQLPENQQTKETLLDSTHALLAPGQGNQRRGMGLDLANSSGAARGVWKPVRPLGDGFEGTTRTAASASGLQARKGSRGSKTAISMVL